jgi:CubicO group peptidase (beta-lactamase class C family)
MGLKPPKISMSKIAPFAAICSGIVVFLFLMTYSIGAYFALRPTAGASEADFRRELDRSAPAILDHFGVPGVVVATVVNGAPSHIYAYGLADIRTHRPMRADTVFRVASISKSLTAWGVLHLVQQGKVDLDSPAEHYLAHWPLPASAFPSQAVTVRRLLNHTAGITAGADTFRRPNEPPLSTLAQLRGQGWTDGESNEPAALVSAAGKSFVYSAAGYTMLQMLIEDQSHRPFADYMKDEVLDPLDMTSSSFRWDEALRARTATGYTADGQPSPPVISQDAAADSLFTTGADLARFIAAPLPDEHLPAGAGVLSANSVEDLFDEQTKVQSLQLGGLGPDRPALGYFIEHSPGHPPIVTNGGYDPGWSSRFYLVPATGDGLVILTNSDLGQPVIAQIASIWSSWRGLPPSGLTSAYRSLGIEAAVLISLLVMIGVSFAFGLVLEVNSGARRFGAFRSTTLISNLLECLLGTSSLLVWVLTYRALRTLPILNAVGTSAIIWLMLVILAKLIFPVTQAAPPKRLSKAYGL